MSDFDPLGSNLIFILSLPRSGSTLLQRILGAHAEVHTTAEPWLMLRPLYALRDSDDERAEYDARLARQGLEDFLGQLDDGDAVYRNAVREYAATLYGAALAQSGKKIFLDKTPRYYHILPELKALFPSARFVFLTRNPAAVLSSTLKTWFDNTPADLESTSNYQDLTLGLERMVDGLRLFGEQALVVRYEDLVRDPAAVMESLCGRLGLDFESSMLEYGQFSTPAGRHGDQVNIDQHSHAVASYVEAWRDNLGSPERNDFAFDYLLKVGPDRVEALGYDYAAIESALRDARAKFVAADSQAHSAADITNAQGEELYAAGDLEGARRKFEEALAQDSDFVLAHNNLAVIHWQQQDPNNAVAQLCLGLTKQPRQRDLVITAGQIFAALGMHKEAVALVCAYLEANPDDQEVLALQAGINASSDSGPAAVAANAADTQAAPVETPPGEQAVAAAEPITIITSIAPKGLEKQKRAVQSWLALGFQVQSLNIQKEIDVLQPEFPGVTFVKATRDGRKLAGRPYVFIDDMLAALKATGNPVVGIVNSDIILRAEASLTDYLRREARGCFLYGSRVDIDSADDHAGKFYHRGFDLFFFDRAVIDKIPATNFMLGIPWWDYWVPFAPMMHGVTVKRIDTPLGYHVWHATNYSDAQLIQFAREFAKACAQAPFIRTYRQCVDENYGNIRYGVLSDGALDYLARQSERLHLPDDVSGLPKPVPPAEGAYKVTAIVSTYNSADFIEACLENLVTQTIAEQIEIIVIDAASPQDERAVVERYQSRYPNIRYHRTPERIGVYAAWNMVVKMARGEYLITCSTNDRLRNDACEILARTLDEQPDVDLVYGNSFLTKVPHESFDNPTLFGLYVWPEYSYDLLVDSCMVGPHPMWRRSVHEELGYFNEDLVALSDQEFWLRLGENHKLLSLPDFTGLYYVSEDSITGDTDLTQIETDQVHAVYQWRYRYGQWFKKRFTGVGLEPDAARQGPLIEVFMVMHGAGGDALADTLDSVAAQAYPNWKLTVISDDACPDALFDEHQQLAWAQLSRSEALGAMLNRLVQQGQPDWMVVLEAGERLDPAFMSDASAYIARRPDWRLVYVDDDRADASGELFDARFKPDFNLEMLRASAYIGNACLIDRSALEAVDGFIDADYGLLYDLILRLHDRFGRAAIGHLADIRFHRRAADNSPADQLAVESRRTALERHLARCGERAQVQDGLLPGTFHVEYALPAQPRVSVLIPALEASDSLLVCLQSVLSKTDYPDFEVRVLVPAKLKAEIRTGLEALAAAHAGLSIVAGGKHHVQALNALAADATGEYLVWLQQDIVVLQAEWLTRLLQQGMREQVGIVGPRVINRRKALVSGGVMSGVGSRGVGARCNEGLHMTSPGYMGRAQLEQEIGSVPSLCMLVSKAQFDAAGGFDPQLKITLYRDVDLCQRVRAQGGLVIWTPSVSVMYLGEREQVDGRVDSAKQVLGELTLMHQRWLSVLARDPSYNRNLSMRRSDFSLECDLVRGWDPEIDTKPRVLSYGTGSYGSWQYRVRQPLDVMHAAGVLQRTHTPFIRKTMIPLPTVVDIERLQPTALLMHNTMHDDLLTIMEKYKRTNDAFIVFGQDDLMTALPPKNPFSKTVYKDVRKRIRKCLSLADRLLVTTEPLAEALRGMIDDVHIVPNYLDANTWNDLASRRGAGDKPRVGWAGAQQHLGDLELLEQVVRETAGEVDWVFFGMCPGFLRPYVKEIHEAVDFARYPEKLAGLNLDIALAPLEHNRFNESKSNLRLLEYGILGWSVIATDIHPYQNAPVCRVPNRARDWINAVRERVADLDNTWKEGDRLRDWVRAEWMMQQNMDRWLQALDPASATATGRGAADRVSGL